MEDAFLDEEIKELVQQAHPFPHGGQREVTLEANGLEPPLELPFRKRSERLVAKVAKKRLRGAS